MATTGLTPNDQQAHSTHLPLKMVPAERRAMYDKLMAEGGITAVVKAIELERATGAEQPVMNQRATE